MHRPPRLCLESFPSAERNSRFRRSNMKVLFIGGTGVISSACSALAVERGIDLFLLNRGGPRRPLPAAAHVLRGDIRDPESAHQRWDQTISIASLIGSLSRRNIS